MCWASLLGGCLTMTYFRARLRTIIGVLPFHGPVRDGKGWCRQAMVVRRRRESGVRHQESVARRGDSEVCPLKRRQGWVESYRYRQEEAVLLIPDAWPLIPD